MAGLLCLFTNNNLIHYLVIVMFLISTYVLNNYLLKSSTNVMKPITGGIYRPPNTDIDKF